MGNGFNAILFAQFTVCIAEVCSGFSVGENPMLEEAEFLHSVCLFSKFTAQNPDSY